MVPLLHRAAITKINKSSAVAEMGDHLATTGMGRKWGGAAVGGWVTIEHNVAWTEAYLFTKWHLDPSNGLATTEGCHASHRNTLTDYFYP